jgi:hypothetical protein
MKSLLAKLPLADKEPPLMTNPTQQHRCDRYIVVDSKGQWLLGRLCLSTLVAFTLSLETARHPDTYLPKLCPVNRKPVESR